MISGPVTPPGNPSPDNIQKQLDSTIKQGQQSAAFITGGGGTLGKKELEKTTDETLAELVRDKVPTPEQNPETPVKIYDPKSLDAATKHFEQEQHTAEVLEHLGGGKPKPSAEELAGAGKESSRPAVNSEPFLGLALQRSTDPKNTRPVGPSNLEGFEHVAKTHSKDPGSVREAYSIPQKMLVSPLGDTPATAVTAPLLTLADSRKYPETVLWNGTPWNTFA